MMIKKFFHSITTKWYIYLILVIIAIVGSNYLVDFFTRPLNEETITLFVTCFNDSNENREFRNYLFEHAPSYLREINIVSVAPNNGRFDELFMVRGLNQADIFILPKEKLSDDLLEKQFATLDEAYLSNYFEYESEESNHGVLLHKQEQDNNDLITYSYKGYDSDFYLFYRINSIHAGGLNDSEFDTSIEFTKAILEYEKE